jgi:hypothetical protein
MLVPASFEEVDGEGVVQARRAVIMTIVRRHRCDDDDVKEGAAVLQAAASNLQVQSLDSTGFWFISKFTRIRVIRVSRQF